MDNSPPFLSIKFVWKNNTITALTDSICGWGLVAEQRRNHHPLTTSSSLPRRFPCFACFMFGCLRLFSIAYRYQINAIVKGIHSVVRKDCHRIVFVPFGVSGQATSSGRLATRRQCFFWLVAWKWPRRQRGSLVGVSGDGGHHWSSPAMDIWWCTSKNRRNCSPKCCYSLY